jgi:EAL domain-containing protein (putative c-di-GMP-specific phosphodiesterase class I)
MESTAQADTVYTAGCRMAQGHSFGRAAPITNISFPGAVSGTVGP